MIHPSAGGRAPRLRARLADDTGSLAFAVLVTFVGMALTLLLVPVVKAQSASTREDGRRVVALSAAQAGLDIALGHIQAASNGLGTGVLRNLPCGPFTGNVGAGGTARYQVTIDYYQVDPRGHEQDTNWLNSNLPIQCINGGGAYVTPSFALLRSFGTDQATGAFSSVPVRSLVAAYKFQITNENIPGGNIRTYKNGLDLCLDAGSSSPAAGTNVALQPCVSPKAIQQQWSLDDASYFEGTSDGKTLNGLCLNAQSPNVAGTFVILGKKSAGTCTTLWSPEAPAGAGAAGPATGQLVNFAQFGRCLDVTNQDVTWPYEIAWPCKQAPDPTTLTWNQVFSIPAVPVNGTSATGPITTVKSGITYCLKSPNSTTMYADYVIVAACGAPTADEVWTVYGNTGNYATSYRIADKNGYCLAPTDQYAANPDLFSNGTLTSKMTVAVCSDSTLQKWNAPPNILQSLPLSNIREG